MLTDRLRECIQKEFENLKNSSSLLRPLIESGGYGLALISSDFHVIEANSRMLEWFPKTHVSTSPYVIIPFTFKRTCSVKIVQQ